MAVKPVKIGFLVPGFSKCGTTTLCALLAQHPEIYIPELKEPWYFSADDMAGRTVEYNRHFAPATEGQLLGEGSVNYSGYQREDIAIERIARVNRNCRFVFIARNPWQRIESSYREMHHSGVKFGLNAPFSLRQCFDEFPQFIKDSCFHERISKYVAAFGEEAILVLFLEDLRENPQRELTRCFRHLQVDDGFPVNSRLRLNEGSSKFYDSRLLRYLRNHPLVGYRLAALDPERQDRLLRPLGLRRSFHGAIQWDPESRTRVRESVVPDARRFLRAFGKAEDFWEL